MSKNQSVSLLHDPPTLPSHYEVFDAASGLALPDVQKTLVGKMNIGFSIRTFGELIRNYISELILFFKAKAF
jgi:hypothetical protein